MIGSSADSDDGNSNVYISSNTEGSDDDGGDSSDSSDSNSGGSGGSSGSSGGDGDSKGGDAVPE